MLAKSVRRTGKDQRLGSYIRGTTEGQPGGLFAGYTKCEHCHVDLKLIMQVQEARALANIVGTDYGKLTWKVRIAKRIQKWAESVTMSSAT